MTPFQPNSVDTTLSIRGFVMLAECRPSDVTEFAHKHFDTSVNVQHWAYRSEGIRLTKRCFGDFRTWLTKQKTSPYLYGRRYDFLVDTFEFIRTGRRKLSVANWYELLEEGPSPEPDLARSCSLTNIPASNPASLISLWCTRPQGFEDMICTLNILFGDPRTTDVPPPSSVLSV